MATVCVYTLTGILSAMTSGSMPTLLTFTLLAGLRRQGTSCSPPKVRPGWIDQLRQRALRSIPSSFGSPFLLLPSPLPPTPFTTSLSPLPPALIWPQGFRSVFPPLSVHLSCVLPHRASPGRFSGIVGTSVLPDCAGSVWAALASAQPLSARSSVHPPEGPRLQGGGVQLEPVPAQHQSSGCPQAPVCEPKPRECP